MLLRPRLGHTRRSLSRFYAAGHESLIYGYLTSVAASITDQKNRGCIQARQDSTSSQRSRRRRQGEELLEGQPVVGTAADEEGTEAQNSGPWASMGTMGSLQPSILGSGHPLTP
ncbi:hypothetical protein PAL_GLEAN10006385 [Pteropus alecto]|uniref:Uncharacterized protein n=1 Tax=Pteropus alecto TaxID=9402 RepID=L5KTU4_PTEAL|nr:hypothetical protein PAL_GLEAN10006385 [Pteropus alecto]